MSVDGDWMGSKRVGERRQEKIKQRKSCKLIGKVLSSKAQVISLNILMIHDDSTQDFRKRYKKKTQIECYSNID
jgi:uncharacterized protein (UPF0216 family)